MAEGELGKLLVEIGANVSELKKGLSEGQKNVESFGKQIDQKLKVVAGSFIAMGAAAVTALGAIVIESVKYGNELDRLAVLTNSTASEVAKLSYAVMQEHGSMEALSRSLPILAKNMNEAAFGSGVAAKSFESLGVQIRNSDGTLKSLTQIMPELATGFQNTADKTRALALAQEILGRGGKELFAVMEKGGENMKALFAQFDSFGFSGEKLNKFAGDAKVFDDTWLEIKTNLQLAGLAITSALLPTLQSLSEKLLTVDWVAVATNIGITAEKFLELGLAIGKVALAMGEFIGVAAFNIVQTFDKIIEKIDQLTGKFVSLGQMFMMLSGGGAGIGGALANNLGGGGIGGLAAGPAGLGGGIVGGTTAGAGAPTPAGPGSPPSGAGAPTPAGGAGPSGAGAGGGGGILGWINATIMGFDRLDSQSKKITTNVFGVFGKMSTGMANVFGQATANMLVSGESFTQGIIQGFKDLAKQFISMVVSMIAKWLMFIAAVMAIAIVLQIFGVPIGATFQAAFALLRGSSGGGAGGSLLGKGLQGFMGMSQGGYYMARNGLYAAASGIAMTGALGEGGIPTMIHPGEIVTPIDKFFDMMGIAQNNGAMTINIYGGNQNPREIAETVALEIERKRRNP